MRHQEHLYPRRAANFAKAMKDPTALTGQLRPQPPGTAYRSRSSSVRARTGCLHPGCCCRDLKWRDRLPRRDAWTSLARWGRRNVERASALGHMMGYDARQRATSLTDGARAAPPCRCLKRAQQYARVLYPSVVSSRSPRSAARGPCPRGPRTEVLPPRFAANGAFQA